MGEKIVLGPVSKGLKNDLIPPYINNDSFPVLINAFQWRGRVKRKRGTTLLNRLKRHFNSAIISYNTGSTTIALNGSGIGNILSGFGLESNANIVPGSVTLEASGGPTVYTDPTMDGLLTPSDGGANTINYASGLITIPAQAGNTVTAIFNYHPDLPVMGFRDLVLVDSQFPGNLAFDTTYSYNVLSAFPYAVYDVSFYKNPSTATYAGYIEKTDITATNWNGKNYQQFWTVNYQGALWATNGVDVPFTGATIGMQYNPIVSVTVTAGGPPATANLQIVAHGLVVGDFLFINEVVTTTGINFQTGYVTTVVDIDNVIVTFPNATIAGNGTGGIAQYLTNRADTQVDCLRWYDGDPTNGDATDPVLDGGLGWVNFAPPLSRAAFTISDAPAAQYYLVGAKLIVPFKDRLVFLGPVIQTSSPNSQIYLPDTILFSLNGTPYYTASFTGDPSLASTVFNPVLVPDNQTAVPNSYWEDQTGFGGSFPAGTEQAINTVSSNEDVLIVGFDRMQARLIYSGNDILPFNLFTINTEYGSNSSFSAVNMDKGVLTRGSRGFVITSQVDCRRFDLDIPDEVFQLRLTGNGNERVCAQRDFINEWIYFTYPVNTIKYAFPTQTLQYNYRDDSWGIFHECYTTYGIFRRKTGLTWGTIGTVYPTWSVWNDPWNSGTSTILQPEVVGGNQQGFLIIRDDGTDEGNSLYIQNISGGTVTSPDHCLNMGDYIVISDALGTVGASVNGKIFSVATATQNSFVLNPPISSGLTYLGGGVIKRMYVPFIQTKQFPVAWDMSRKTRLGPQQYLFTTTDNAQVQLLIYLSQDADNAYNSGPIVPLQNVQNNALVYSTVLYTCPESTNLGLTPANINLQMVTAVSQQRIWHRVNTSLIGDTVQVAFSLSDEQMRDQGFVNQFAEIELHAMILDVNPSQVLA